MDYTIMTLNVKDLHSKTFLDSLRLRVIVLQYIFTLYMSVTCL